MCVGGGRVQGDATVISKAMKAATIAEIFVEEGSLRIDLEIGSADLTAFKNIWPDELYAKANTADAGAVTMAGKANTQEQA